MTSLAVLSRPPSKLCLIFFTLNILANNDIGLAGGGFGVLYIEIFQNVFAARGMYVMTEYYNQVIAGTCCGFPETLQISNNQLVP